LYGCFEFFIHHTHFAQTSIPGVNCFLKTVWSKMTNFSTKFELQVIVQLSLTYYRHHRCAQLCVKYRLVNLTMCSDIPGHQVWRSGTFTEKPQSSLSARDHTTSVEWSTLSSLGKISQVQKSTPYLCRGLYHSSRHPADVWTLGTSQYMVRFTTH